MLNARFANTNDSADTQLQGRLPARRIAELVGYERASAGRAAVQRWRAGGVPLYSADRAAVRAGAHPSEIWPEFLTLDAPSDGDPVHVINESSAR